MGEDLVTPAPPAPLQPTDVACRIPVRDIRAERVALRRQADERALLRHGDRRDRRERHAGYAVYWMYLVSPLSGGVTALVGLLMASARAAEAGEVAASHFRFQVRAFWGAFLAALTGGAWAAIGGIASVGGAEGGGALALAGAGLAAASGVGFMAASILGLSRLVSRTPMGRLPRD